MVEAATSLLDDYGIADLSMRRLARELEVSPGLRKLASVSDRASLVDQRTVAKGRAGRRGAAAAVGYIPLFRLSI